MPNNGAAACLPFPEPASSVAVAKADKPAAEMPFDPRLGGADGWIDAICHALAETFVQAGWEIRSGRLTGETKSQGADLLGRLVVLQSMVGEHDFAATVTRASLSETVIGDILEAVNEIATAARAMN